MISATEQQIAEIKRLVALGGYQGEFGPLTEKQAATIIDTLTTDLNYWEGYHG